MSSTHKRILNLIVILGLLLVMLPQQGSIAQADVSNPVSPNQPDDSEEIFRQPYAGPERELDNTIQAGDKILNIAGWHFYPYFEQCEGRFRGESFGKNRPQRDSLCFVLHYLSCAYTLWIYI